MSEISTPSAPIPPPPPPPPYYMPPQRKKSRWWIPLLIVVGVFVLMIVSFIGIIAAIGSSVADSFEEEEVVIKNNSVLYINFKKPLQEYDKSDGFSFDGSSDKTLSFFDALNAIKRAKNDENIKGIYYVANGNLPGMAKMVELQEAMVDFKSSGKFIYSYIETGNKNDYFFALPSDSIFMPREGFIEGQAMGASVMFYKNMLDKIGVNVHVQQFEEYKSFGETFSRTNFSDPAKEELRVLLQQRHELFVSSVASFRNLALQQVAYHVDKGIYRADSLWSYGWINGIATETQVRDIIKSRLGISEQDNSDNEEGNENKKKKKSSSKLELVSLKTYAHSNSGTDETEIEDKEIAIIYGVGGIRTGKTSSNPFGGGDMEIASTSFIEDLRRAREDDDIKAIIIRIDSPGGSALASDMIWEEIQKTKKVKPVYASMSDVAASGGYYIPMACDTIVASPYTITGSIGVISVIPNFAGTIDKVGITVDTINMGKSSQFMNPLLAYTDADKARLKGMMEPIYTSFVSKAAQSRKKTYEDMRMLAKGRVWTGADAHKNGLVDVLGGFQTAIDLAKKRIGVKKGNKVQISIYPRQKDKFQELLESFGIGKEKDEEDAHINEQFKSFVGNAVLESVSEKSALPAPVRQQITDALNITRIGMKEKVQMALPYSVHFE